MTALANCASAALPDISSALSFEQTKSPGAFGVGALFGCGEAQPPLPNNDKVSNYKASFIGETIVKLVILRISQLSIMAKPLLSGGPLEKGRVTQRPIRTSGNGCQADLARRPPLLAF